MASPVRIRAVPLPVRQPKIDYMEKCRCGHYRYEHHEAFGCMQWDSRRPKGWCSCDGFARRQLYEC
jgi:hypothetical protein